MTARISHNYPKTPVGLRFPHATMACMSPEMYTIISVAIGLAALILNGQRGLWALRKELNELRSEMHREFAAVRKEFAAVHKEFVAVRAEIAAVREQVAALAERVARLEGVIPGPRDFARDTGTGNRT